MGLLTESDLRAIFKNKDTTSIHEYFVEAGTVVTPSAKTFLSEKKIQLIVGNKPKTEQMKAIEIESLKAAESNLPPVSYPKRYESVQGGTFEEKPEFMTQIYGNKLVFKDHKIVKLRGMIDSFEAKIVQVQIILLKLGVQKAVDDLQEILEFVQKILRCEVLNEQLEEISLLGMDADEIRARSHNPKKYYDMNHFSPSYKHGEEVAALNLLRTGVREVELTAYDAFKDEYGIPDRNDLIRGLNRLSSLFYIMMFKFLANEYR